MELLIFVCYVVMIFIVRLIYLYTGGNPSKVSAVIILIDLENPFKLVSRTFSLDLVTGVAFKLVL